jgi:integrase
VRPSTFAVLAAQLKQEGKAPATINRVSACFHTALKEAALDGRLDAVPVYRQQKEPPSRREYYTPTEIKRLIKTAPKLKDGELLQQTIQFLFLTGCRRAECLGLKWVGTDEVGNTHQCVNFTTNKLLFLDTKNGEHHSVDIHPQLLPILQQLHAERTDDGAVFRWGSPDTLNRRMKTLCKRCGLVSSETGQSQRLVHAIRHSTATSLVEAGVPIRSIQGLLNHKKISTTTLYAKVNDLAKQDAISNLTLPV